MSRSASDLARPVAASIFALCGRGDASRFFAGFGDHAFAVLARLTDHPVGLRLGVRQDPVGFRAGVVEQRIRLSGRRGHHRIRVRLGLVQQRVAGVEDVLGVVQLTRNCVLDVIDQFEHVTTRDHAARGHRHATSFLDNGAQLVERLKNSVHGNTLPASLLLPVCLVLLL